MSRRPQMPFDTSQLRPTKGALVILFLVAGVSMVFQLASPEPRLQLVQWLVPSTTSVWQEWKLWTLATGPLFETSFFSLILQGLITWLFLPNLERWWGTKRFVLFAIYTSLAATTVGTLSGFVFGYPVGITGLDPFIYAAIVAFGITHGRQPVQFFGVLPLTARQMMYGILAFVGFFIVLTGAWGEGIGYAAAIGVAVVMTSSRWNPRSAWLRWRGQRARRRLEVLDGGKRKGDDKRWVN